MALRFDVKFATAAEVAALNPAFIIAAIDMIVVKEKRILVDYYDTMESNQEQRVPGKISMKNESPGTARALSINHSSII